VFTPGLLRVKVQGLLRVKVQVFRPGLPAALG